MKGLKVYLTDDERVELLLLVRKRLDTMRINGTDLCYVKDGKNCPGCQRHARLHKLKDKLT